MRLLILDPRNGDSKSHVFVVDPQRQSLDTMELGYVPELVVDPINRELIVVETELDTRARDGGHYRLAFYDTETLALRESVRTPTRPMYAGFPGRSSHVVPTRSGRYVYFLESGLSPARSDVFRMSVHRYSRDTSRVQSGTLSIDSCVIELGHLGIDDDEFFLHLSCDYPSTVAFGRFDRGGWELVVLEESPARTHLPVETCGSWTDRENGVLYCVNGEGSVYAVGRPPEPPTRLLRLPLGGDTTVPLHSVCGQDGHLFVGASGDAWERGIGLASEFWVISLADSEVERRFRLPHGVINYVVSSDGQYLFGVNPHRQALYVVDATSGTLLDEVIGLGVSPGEVVLIENTESPAAGAFHNA